MEKTFNLLCSVIQPAFCYMTHVLFLIPDCVERGQVNSFFSDLKQQIDQIVHKVNVLTSSHNLTIKHNQMHHAGMPKKNYYSANGYILKQKHGVPFVMLSVPLLQWLMNAFPNNGHLTRQQKRLT